MAITVSAPLFPVLWRIILEMRACGIVNKNQAAIRAIAERKLIQFEDRIVLSGCDRLHSQPDISHPHRGV
jgi:hypothetical protein